MKKIIYNKDFLPNLVKRIIEKDHATKSMIVDALNEKDDKKKTSLSQLNLWIKDEAVLPTKKIINLVNNMENVSLFDFFINECWFKFSIIDYSYNHFKPQPSKIYFFYKEYNILELISLNNMLLKTK